MVSVWLGEYQDALNDNGYRYFSVYHLFELMENGEPGTVVLVPYAQEKSAVWGLRYIPEIRLLALFQLIQIESMHIHILLFAVDILHIPVIDSMQQLMAIVLSTQRRFAEDGYRFYEFIQEGILHTMEINYAVNFKWLFTMQINGKTDYVHAGEKFKEIVLDRYAKS